LALCVAAVFSFTGCPGDDDGPGGGGYFIPPYRDTTKMTRRWDPTDVLDPEGRESMRVIQTVWYEPGEDPRQVIGYQLKDKDRTPFFDHVTILYGMRLRYGDCGPEGVSLLGDRCTARGLHACSGVGDRAPQAPYLTKNWETYYKPVQERGIKVILSLVPMGGGARVGNLFSSPSWNTMRVSPTNPEDTRTLAEAYDEYPYNETEVYKLIDQIADVFIQCHIDGIGFDEEYAEEWKTNDGKSFKLDSDAKNIIRFSYELDQAMKARGRQEHLINEFYEWGISVPASVTFTNRKGEEVTVYRDDQIDWTFSTVYGTWTPSSTAGTPKHKYGPASIAIADTQNSPRPPYDEIESKMRSHLYGSYGAVMYYCLRSRDELRLGRPEIGTPPFPLNMYGPGNAGKPEAYFSKVSQMLYGYETEYVGRDYPIGFW
jgi:hypothetical protein